MSSLVGFIAGLTGTQLEQLFLQPYCVVSILRSLQPLSRHLLLRFACSGGDVNAALVASWARPDGDSKLGAALQELVSLHLLALAARGAQSVYAVNPSFQAQLRHAMCSELLSEQQAAAQPPPATTPSAAELSEYARGQWDALLLYLVDGNNPPEPPAALRAAKTADAMDIQHLLTSAGLMLKEEGSGKQSISESGFQFLLADLYSQLWAVVRQYLSGLGAGGGGADLAVAINFLLRLGLQAGRTMCFQQLETSEQTIAAHMAQLGLLMPVPAGGKVWLHPTRLASVLAGGGGVSDSAAAAEDGFAIVESNFRVYAYTTSAVQVAVLRVFVRCDALLPNLFVGTITRDSATGALQMGISAEQMVSFLRQHAHPRVAAKTPIVPPVVADQIRLWQQELGRLSAESSMLYSDFESLQLYSSSAAYAQQLGAVLYKDDEKRHLAVPAAFHPALRDYIKQQKSLLGL